MAALGLIFIFGICTFLPALFSWEDNSWESCDCIGREGLGWFTKTLCGTLWWDWVIWSLARAAMFAYCCCCCIWRTWRLNICSGVKLAEENICGFSKLPVFALAWACNEKVSNKIIFYKENFNFSLFDHQVGTNYPFWETFRLK